MQERILELELENEIKLELEKEIKCSLLRQTRFGLIIIPSLSTFTTFITTILI